MKYEIGNMEWVANFRFAVLPSPSGEGGLPIGKTDEGSCRARPPCLAVILGYEELGGRGEE